MKAHEQTLSVHPLDSRIVINEEGLVVADIRETLSGEGREFAALFAASGDMARALIRVAEESAGASVDGIPCYCLAANRKAMRRALGVRARHEEWCNEARDALRKAGVLP